MNAIDTNVLVYRLDRSDPQKQAVARKLIRDLSRQGESILLWQVAGEFQRQLARWRDQGQLSTPQIAQFSRAIRSTFPLVLPSESTLDRAIELAQSHMLSHWDSMLVAACIEAGVTTLFTEDMGAPRTIETVELLNPF